LRPVTLMSFAFRRFSPGGICIDFIQLHVVGKCLRGAGRQRVEQHNPGVLRVKKAGYRRLRAAMKPFPGATGAILRLP
jgi:hypothetical protein